MLIDNAYFACIPPPQEEKIVFTRPTMLDFIRTQIISINANRMEHTVRLLRKIDWTDVKLVGKFHLVFYLDKFFLIIVKYSIKLSFILQVLVIFAYYC